MIRSLRYASFRNKLTTFALSLSLSPPPSRSLSFSHMHVLSLHSHSLPLAFNPCHSDPFPLSHALPPLTLPLAFSSHSHSFSLSLSVLLSFFFFFSLFWERYRYPPLCLNCRSRDSRPRRARLRGLPPATILPTQQQQGRFTSLISKASKFTKRLT